MERKRPKCGRCKGPLDIWLDPDTGINLECNNPKPMYTDKEFWERFDSLDGDDVVKLLKWYDFGVI
ncbi:hypothetical protein C4577_02170 [Candidatus Parcubacteria bacterium]|nr:MAG: hypothetical protein C4577_02170 [Candidatus Parcubacteria bacterium]